MTNQNTETASKKALKEFEAIRNVLRVPFPEDMRDLTPPIFPDGRRWKGPCLGYSKPDILAGQPTQMSVAEPKSEKKT